MSGRIDINNNGRILIPMKIRKDMQVTTCFNYDYYPRTKRLVLTSANGNSPTKMVRERLKKDISQEEKEFLKNLIKLL